MLDKQTVIERKKRDIIKKYGTDPVIYSSGESVNLEKDFPKNMRIILDSKVIGGDAQ